MGKDKVSLSVSLWPEQLRVLQECAKKVDKPLARFLREDVIPRTAHHHHIPMQALPVIQPARFQPQPDALPELALLRDPRMVDALARTVVGAGKLESFLTALARYEKAS